MVVKVNETIKVDGRVVRALYVDSLNSPRDKNNKLVLRQNPFYLSRYNQTYYARSGTAPSAYDIGQWGTGPQQYPERMAEAVSMARARLVGKLHYKGASLGVTFAQHREAKDMVTKRMRGAYQVLQRARSIERKREFRRDVRKLTELPLKELGKQIGGHHLEWIFGWTPLIQDVHNSMYVLTGDVPGERLTATGKSFTFRERFQDVGGLNYSQEILSHRAQWTCFCSVSNPNLWLANHLGLINPAVVLWDLVPWSFVVNMFVNVNQVLNGMTDLTGLSITNSSVTRTTRGVRTQSYRPSPYYTGSSSCTHTVRMTDRYLGQPPVPSLTFKAPEFNLETAAMFASLALQRVRKIESMLNRASTLLRR